MARLAVPPLLAALLALLPVAARGAGPWSLHVRPRGVRAIADGRAETPGGEVPALLRVHCKKARRSELCISVKVEGAAQIEGFDFAAFADPAGAGRGQPLLHARAGEDLSVDVPVEGEWTTEPPGSFAFTVCGAPGGASGAANVARAIDSGTGEVELRIRQPAGDAREIRAHFPADAEDHAVGEVLARCTKH